MTTTTTASHYNLDPSLTRLPATNTAAAYRRGLERSRRKHELSLKRVLDYGTGYGRGLATLKLPNNYVDAYDPAPVDDWTHPNVPLHTSTDALSNDYTLILCVYVLNVLEPVDRRAVVYDILNRLVLNGHALFAVRTWTGDVRHTKTGIPAPEPRALYVPHGRDTYTYQRGYDYLELVNELDWYVDTYAQQHSSPDYNPVYTVLPVKSDNATTYALIRKDA